MVSIKENPCFSILLPTKDRPEMLRRAIQSVMKQTFDDYELIIIDDGSKADNQPILENFPQAKIKYVKNSVSQGVSAARNRGIHLAKGKYISLLDDDDEYLPNFLETTYQALHQTPAHIGFSWSSLKHIYYSKDGKINKTEIKKYPHSYRSLESLFLDVSVIGVSYGVTFKASCFERYGGFDTNFYAAEDTELILRLLSKGVIPIVIPEVIILHNHHQEVRLSKNFEYFMKEKIYETIIKRHESFLIKYPLLWITQYFWIFTIYVQSGDRKHGKLVLEEMVKKIPYRAFVRFFVRKYNFISLIMISLLFLKIFLNRKNEVRKKIKQGINVST